MNEDISFGCIVKEYRHAHDLTQAELARRVACATITIRKIEADALRPSQQIAEHLAIALAIPQAEQTNFVRLARTASLVDRAPPSLPTAPPVPEEVGQKDLSGRAIRGYALGERIAVGGFGAVYHAIQPYVEREVAVKIILPQYADHPDFIRRFEAEAQLVACLEHPYIIPLYDYWREPGSAYLVMRLMRGGSLQDKLKEGPLALDTTLGLLQQIGDALHSAHRAGVVHRDVKPANILLDEDDNAYLADFGFAKNLGHANLAEQTQADTIIGSLEYISPEQIQAERVKPQSDIYCLGIMFYEMLTGHKPFQGVTPVDYIQQHLTEPLPPLSEHYPDTTADQGMLTALDAVLTRATAKNPSERYPDVMAMLSDVQETLSLHPATAIAFRQSVGKDGQPSVISRQLEVESPYKGLRAFGEADAADFFGRETVIQTLLGRMAGSDDPSIGSGQELSRFLAVVGPSGSGKSSVVRAGLIPALRQGGLPGSEAWFIVTMIPGTHPLEELEAALLRVAINPPESLLTQLWEDERGLLRAVRRILPADETTELVLVIDQFEEIFTLCSDEASRTHLLDSLVMAVLDPRSRLRVVITLRADFTDRPLQYVDFGELVRHRTEFVLPLSPDEMEEAIAGPAKRVGLTLEPGLPETIIGDLGDQPGTLPLLQYTLTELFERRVGNALTLGAYQASGGVRRVLASRADKLYTELDDVGQQAARLLFLRLITLGEITGDGLSAPDTRRRVLRSELASLTADGGPQTANGKGAKGHGYKRDEENSTIQKVIDQYGRHRLLTFDRDLVSRGPTVEVAHEALIREWSRLRQWLDEDREFLLWQQRLRAALHQWEASEQDEGALLRGAPLNEAENWFDQREVDLSDAERNFIRASLGLRQQRAAEREAQRQRELEAAQKLAETEKQRAEEQTRATRHLRWLVVGLATFLLVAVGLTLFAFNRQAEAETNLALSESQRLAAEANTILQSGGNAELAALLSLRALNTAYTPQADMTLQQASKKDYGRRLFTGHTGSVDALAFSPDGQYALSGSNDKTARLWDVQTGQLLYTLTGHTAGVIDVVFSSDSRYILTGSDDKTARLWDVQTGQEMQTLTGHKAGVTGVAFSPDGRYVYTGSREGTVWLWDVETGQKVRVLGEEDGLSAVAVSSDGQYVLTGNMNEMRLWEAKTGQELHRFTGPTGGVESVSFSPDGRYVLASDRDGFVRRWDLQQATAAPLVFSGHTEPVPDLAVSPDGQFVLTVSWDNTARLWDIETGQELRWLVHTSHAHSLAFSPDGQTMLIGVEDGLVRLWDVQPPPDPHTFIGHTGVVAAAKFSPDGRYVLTGGADQTARLWDAATNQELRAFRGHNGWAWAVAFSPDGRYALTGSFDTTARVWDVETGREVRALTHPTEVFGVAFSPDGRYILTGGEDKVARLWDFETGREVRVFTGHTEPVTGVAFSPDGRYILTGSTEDRTTRLWEVATGGEIRQFPGYTGFINGLSFSPDSKDILTADEEYSAKLWEVETGRALGRFSGDNGVFSLDGNYMLTGGLKTAYLWDRATGRQLRVFGVANNLWSVAISPDGQQILISGSDQIAQLWDTDYRVLADAVCGRVLRDFTDKEREQYGINDQQPTCPSGI